MELADRLELFTRFRAANPTPTTELEFSNPFDLLVAGLLSAQAPDRSGNPATRKPLRGARTPAASTGV